MQLNSGCHVAWARPSRHVRRRADFITRIYILVSELLFLYPVFSPAQ